jgi:sugar phosphate isomerase/epimerase
VYRTRWFYVLLILSAGMVMSPWIGVEQAAAGERQSVSVHAGPLLGMQSYSFKQFTFFDGLEKTAALGLKYTEGSGGRVVSDARPNFKFSDMLEITEEAMDVRREVKKKLQDLGIQMLSYGVVALPNNESQCRQVFDFAKDMGIQIIVSEPPEEALDLIDRLCKEYRIKVAIHNHAAPSPYWHPDILLRACKGRSEMIGACADTGHWMRSGLNPVKMLEKLQGRIVCVHLKDRSDYGQLDTHDVPWGTGKGRIREMLSELDRQNFRGPVSIEYEYNWDNSVPDVRQCIDYFGKISGELISQRLNP